RRATRAVSAATGHRVQRQWLGLQGRIRLTDQLQQVAIQVEVAGGDQVDDRDRDTVLEKRGTLGDEDAAGFGLIVVRGADDLDRRHQTPTARAVVDAYLVFDQLTRMGGRSQVDTRSSDKILWQFAIQRHNNHRRPTSIKTFPRSHIIERWAEV